MIHVQWMAVGGRRETASGFFSLIFDFNQFGLRGGELIFQIYQFSRIVRLFFSPGDLLPQILDPLMEGVDFLFDFFVHNRMAN
jgi:hypothetical protein